MNNKISVFYDCTKLVQLINSTQFNGILRADVEYLIHFITRNKDFNIYGIFEATKKKDEQNYLAMLPSKLVRKICDIYDSRWLVDAKALKAREKEIKIIIDEIAFIFQKINLISGTRLDAKIKNFSDSSSVYVNCSFFSIVNTDGHAEQIKNSGLKPFYVVYDLLPLEFPELFWNDDIPLRHFNIVNAMASDDSTLISISHDVNNKLQNLVNQIGITCKDFSVSQCGVSEVFLKNKLSADAVRDYENKFTIFCTIEPRKNHILLLNVWREMINSGAADIPKLSIVGRRGWNNEDVFRFLDKSPAIKKYVTVFDNLKDEDMIKEIKSSRATLFPSLGEGWGLPIVESIAMGVPVICSDIPVHRECSQGLATYIHPLDGLGWQQEILKQSQYSQQDDLQQRLKIASFNPIAWADSANAICAAILKIK
jgi:glycosyltransferase involved in cell wall biosynthesis